MNIQPKYFGNLDPDVSRIIIKNVCSEEINTHENDLENRISKITLKAKTPALHKLFQDSLDLLPLAFSLGLLSKTSKSFRALCIEELGIIKKQIENKFIEMSTIDSEAYFFREYIERSIYLPVLRVYYTIAPEALQKLSKNILRHNIVHTLVIQKNIYLKQPPWFFSFVLKMNEHYFASNLTQEINRDLLAQKDISGNLPIHSLCANYKDVKRFGATLVQLFESPSAGLYVNELVCKDRFVGVEMVPPLYFLKDSECIELLLSKGANVNVQNDEGNTVLHLWAKELKYELISIILKKGADLTIKNEDGETALDFFINHSFELTVDPEAENIMSDWELRTFKCLLDHGASIEKLLRKLYVIKSSGATEKRIGPRSAKRVVLDLLKSEYKEILTSTLDKMVKVAKDREELRVKRQGEAQAKIDEAAKPQPKVEIKPVESTEPQAKVEIVEVAKPRAEVEAKPVEDTKPQAKVEIVEVAKPRAKVEAKLVEDTKPQARAEIKPEAKIETAKSLSGFFNYIFKIMLKPFRSIFGKAMSLFSFARSSSG